MNYFRKEEASVAVIFGVTVIPILVAVGSAIDYSQATNMRSQMTTAADNAVLYAAKHYDGSNLDDLKIKANQVYLNNLPTNIKNHQNSFSLELLENNIFHYTGSGISDTSILKLFNTNHLHLDVFSQAAVPPSKFVADEITYVFDTTNSLEIFNDETWERMTDFIEQQANKFSNSTPNGSNKPILSFIPFQDRVNVSAHAQNEWFSSPTPANWKGCVEPAYTPMAGENHYLDDAPPTVLQHEPTAGNAKWPALWYQDKEYDFVACSDPMFGPTKDISNLETYLNSLKNRGTGRHDEALAWGWRMLSSRWKNQWGLTNYPADEGDAKKLLVYISDLRGNAWAHDGLYEGSMNTADKDGGSAYYHENMRDLCSRIKDSNIEIATFLITSDSHKNMNQYDRVVATMEQCASPERYYIIENEEDVITALESTLIEDEIVRLVK